MASAIASVVRRLGEMAVAEAALLRGVDDYIPLLRDKLEWMHTFIQQESGQEGSNAYVDLWVRQTREVAYQVEDVLDEFLTKVDLDNPGIPLWEKWLKYIGGCTTHISVRHDLKTRMDFIKNRLKEISDNASTYKVERVRSNGASSSSAANPSVSRPFAEWNEETAVIGFLREREDLECRLLESDTSRSVIAVVGESGTGKSKLAWEIYESPIIKSKFDVRAWINVPPEIRDDDAILYFIYKRLLGETDEDALPSTTGEVHQALSKYLQDERYLVVIDGLVNFTKWDSLLQGLPKNGRGGKVMIITSLKGKEVAFANPNVHLHNISNLSKEDSTQLFHRRVFGDNYQFRDKVFDSRSSESVSLMDKIHKDVFEITEGLPLAIVVLAGLLQTRSIGDWDKVLKQLKSSTESTAKPVERILALSYGDLPIHLKSCFLYFAGFPKNMIFSARRLVRLWAAEGFLQPEKKGETMEDIGQNNLRELLSRRMISLVKKDLNGGVWLVAINYHVHAFAESQAQEASFLVVHDNNVDIPSPASVRRLYLQNYVQSSVHTTSFPMLWSILCNFAEDRSYSVEPHSRRFWGRPLMKQTSNSNDLRYHALSFLQRCKFLRVIDLRGLQIRMVSHAIGDMVHVRYLGLRSPFLTELPSSIARLTKLQTLDIKITEVQKVAQAFWEIPTLRHVIAKKLRLPKSSRVLLNNMQTLTGLVCSDPSGNEINRLHNMVYLRHLEISGLTKQHFQGLADVFKNLESLLCLRLAGDDIPFTLFTSFTLRLLQTLELIGRIDTSNVDTEYKCTLPNLTRLVLKLSMADQMFINMIGELPSLIELVLSDDSYHGEKLMFSDNGFKNITTLLINNLTQLSEWTIRTKSIPKITRIILSGCYKLKIKLDMEQGLEEGLMEELNEVVVNDMPPEIFIEPADSVFGNKINRVAMGEKRGYLTDRLQRNGRWRSGMIEGNMYNH